VHRIQMALEQRRFLKIILGASLSDATLTGELTRVYGQLRGVTCLDIAAEPHVLASVDAACRELEAASADATVQAPIVMMSLDVDADPHFRKVVLNTETCVDCEACIPTCPSQALALKPLQRLEVSEPLCYGCGRCVPVCPTNALSMHQQHRPTEALFNMLTHPRVQALELHSHFARPDELAHCMEQLGSVLQGKVVSLCFRPLQLSTPQQSIDYIQHFEALCQHHQVGLALLQLDGLAMSGVETHEQSLPALQSVQRVISWMPTLSLPITISGGINQHTPQLIRETQLSHVVAGVGIGTVARQWVRNALNEADALKKARRLVERFAALATETSDVSPLGTHASEGKA
jgi:ferredoxin